jgi:hypothetical protein
MVRMAPPAKGYLKLFPMRTMLCSGHEKGMLVELQPQHYQRITMFICYLQNGGGGCFCSIIKVATLQPYTLRYLIYQFFRLTLHEHVTILIAAAALPPGAGIAKTNIVQTRTLFRAHHFQSPSDAGDLVREERYGRWEMENLLAPVSIYGKRSK